MEEEHQNGLAHVLEHMAFHATEHFPEGVPAFLKRRGIQDLNACTGAVETVYHIDGVPTTDGGLVDSCCLSCTNRRASCNCAPTKWKMNAERVALREHHQGMDLSQRMQSQLNAYLYNHSKTARPRRYRYSGSPEPLRCRRSAHLYWQLTTRPAGGHCPQQHRRRCRGGRSETPLCRHSEAHESTNRGNICHSGQRRASIVRLSTKIFPQNAVVLMKRFRKKPEFRYTRRTGERPVVPGVLQSNRGERLNDFIQEEDALFLSAQAGVHDLVRHYEGQNIAITPLPGMEKEAVRQVLEQLERIHRYAITDQKLKELTNNYRLGLKQSAAMLRRMPNSVYLKSVCRTIFCSVIRWPKWLRN